MESSGNAPINFGSGENAEEQALSQALEFALEYTLERRWFDGFDARREEIAPHRGGDLAAESRVLRVKELAHSGNIERSLNMLNMQNVLSSFRDGSHSILFALRGQGHRVAMYMGVRRFIRDERVQTVDYVDVLRRGLASNFPGIITSENDLTPRQTEREILVPLTQSEFLACVAGIPSLKQNATGYAMQTMDRLIDALRGDDYTLLVLAEPVIEKTIIQAIGSSRQLTQEIHSLVHQAVAVSQGDTIGDSTNRTEGTNFNAGTAGLLGMLFGLSLGRSWQNSFTESQSRSTGLSVTREALNKTAEFCEKMLDHFLERLQNGRNLGFWNVGLFLASNDFNTFMRAQGVVRGLFSGQDTHFEPLRLIDLTHVDSIARDALAHLNNPALVLKNHLEHPLGTEFQKLATPLNTQELSILIGFPHREVPGLALRPIADFGLNPPRLDEGIVLGNVLDQGEILDELVCVPTASLFQHTFITGFTGAGKTNTCLVLLREAYRRDIPFLVIEPAKTEYRVLLADAEIAPNLQVFTLGEEQTSKFRLNPFEFVRGFNLLTHIDFLRAVFNASFPMYASMPYILEEAVLEIYTDRGWNIATSRNRFVDITDDTIDYTPYLPTLGDLFEKIDGVVQRKKYAAQLTLDITAALKARLQSLMNGAKGYMLNTQRSISIETLLRRPTVLELRSVGDDDEKAFLMALLLILIYEESQTRALRSGLGEQGFRHLTLIEEAHRLLKNVSFGGSLEVANPRGKAVEMFTDILSEVREYGEGFVIVDQIPAKLTPDVVKNTNLKILHRLLAQDDRFFVGNAMNLSPGQLDHVVRLKTGEGIVHFGGLDNSILVKIAAAKGNLKADFEKGVGARGLEAHMKKFRAAHADEFRRWSGCAVCPSPCDFLSEWNGPTSEALQQFQTFFNTLVYGDIAASPGKWREVERSLRAALTRRYGQEQLREGDLLCHLVQLARGVLGSWQQYYNRTGENTDIFVALHQRVMDVLVALHASQSETANLEDLVALRAFVWEHVAIAPKQARPGCVYCRSVCKFGLVVQNQIASQAGALNQRVKQAFQDPAALNDYSRLVLVASDFARERFVIPAAPELLPQIGYCYLANATTHLRALNGFQEALDATRSHGND